MTTISTDVGGPADDPRDERETLVAALIAVIAAAGFRHATVDAVVARAELDRAAFARHFDDLEDGFVAAWERVNECFTGTMIRAFSREHTWREGVRAAARAAIRLAELHPRLARILFLDVLEAGEGARARCAESARLLAQVLDMPSDGLQDRPPGLGPAAEALIGGIYTTVALFIRRRGPGALPELVPELACTVVTTYLGAEVGVEELELARFSPDDRRAD